LSGNGNTWFWLIGYATSGANSLYAADLGTAADSVIWANTPVALVTDVYLHFRHSFGFESDDLGFHYDGGVVEYSTDDSTWLDLGPLFDEGQDYGGTIDSGF
jgi:hypothetical protein